MTNIDSLHAEKVEGSLEWIIEQNPDKIFEGKILQYEDAENGVDMVLDPTPNACSICCAPPVVFRTSAMVPGIATGFCEQHKSAWASVSKKINDKWYHWFIL